MTEYRAFDCYDPAARAPTPLPPMFLEDDVEGESAKPLTSSNGELKHTTISSGQRTSLDFPITPKKRFKNESTPSSKASKGKTDNSSSPLSEFPSDLSDWESSKKKVRWEFPKCSIMVYID